MPHDFGTCLLAAGLLFAAGCATEPPSHFVRLWPLGNSEEPVIGLSTEDGVLVLASPNFDVGDMFNLQFPYGNSGLVDFGMIDHLNEDLALIHPISSRLLEGRLATEPPLPHETLYVAQRDEQDQPVMQIVDPWKDGRFGDYVVLPGEDDPQGRARQLAGSGLYVQRNDRWQIVGLMAGITALLEGDAPQEAGMGFIGLFEIVRVLPDRLDYFERDIKQLRPDFEFGVPLQPGDVELPPAPEPGATDIETSSGGK